ncbi:hypothetical protein VE00_01107 [Pseudogymnoascus sp. WSF 3629]|nr:hypothetical protein VE00_01107 [Pseudogymnoascus sp. WSF 3629]
MSEKSQNIYRGAEGAIKQTQGKVRALGPLDVRIKITHSSLCATDLLYLPAGIALGHEGVGLIEEIGSAVQNLKIGDRVGGGFHRGSCGHCRYCLKGEDIFCSERVIFGESDSDNGTFSDYYIGRVTYVHKIPDSIASEHAAPLQCAGATVYGALVDVVKPAQRVGIIGIGGLGHLAIQFASKMGAEVVVFSRTDDKEKEARGFGADEFYLLSNPAAMKDPVDVLVLTGSRYPDWDAFLKPNVLARNGKVVPLLAPHGPMELPAGKLLTNGYDIESHLVASRGVHNDMLKFAAHHKITPAIEKFDLSEEGIGKAVEKMKSGSIRYRGVLVAK